MARVTPTRRTLGALRDRGLSVAIVEKFNAFVGPHGIRQDMFGIIDVIALDHTSGVIGVQSCGNQFSEHYRKLTEDKAAECIDWLKTPGTSLELWAWRKVKIKRGGKAERYEPRVKVFTLEDFGVSDDELFD